MDCGDCNLEKSLRWSSLDALRYTLPKLFANDLRDGNHDKQTMAGLADLHDDLAQPAFRSLHSGARGGGKSCEACSRR